MIETDSIVTTVTSLATFDRLPTGFGDPDPTDLDRLAASLDYLGLSCCEFGSYEASERPAHEPMAEQV